MMSITACQTVPTKSVIDDQDFSLSTEEENIIRALQLETEKSWVEAAQFYQSMAENAQQPERSAYYIRAGLMFYYQQRYNYIEPYFNALKDDDILEQDKRYIDIILAGSFLGIGKIYQSLLTLPNIEEIEDFRFKALALNIRSKGVLAIGKPMESAQLRMQISEFLKSEDEIEENHAFIWQALNRITESTIVKALAEQQTSEMRGWLELNLIARRSNMLPSKIEPWIDQWYQLYGEHPAAPNFAINLLEESRRIYIKPAKIALMLPFSGRLEKVSEAILNGFMYSYYQNNENAAALQVIDASTDPVE
ncbi:MAG: penicillin-binding protein activator, partial [Gammaproteobacteria bacterium]|nr:penicillin-binding protein activator [Gammaproteobacteria bacterium]